MSNKNFLFDTTLPTFLCHKFFKKIGCSSYMEILKCLQKNLTFAVNWLKKVRGNLHIRSSEYFKNAVHWRIKGSSGVNPMKLFKRFFNFKPRELSGMNFTPQWSFFTLKIFS